MMTSVIRVKRRIDDDPAEALVLSCKKQRHSEEPTAETESIFSFAGTLQSKAEPVSNHIKNAIRQRKLHRELHPRNADTRSRLPAPVISSQLRKETKEASQANRYRITFGRRALDLDLLDKNDDDLSSDKNSPCSDDSTSNSKSGVDKADDRQDDSGCVKCKSKRGETNSENKENVTNQSEDCTCDKEVEILLNSSNETRSHPGKEDVQKNSRSLKANDSECLGASGIKSHVPEDKMFCIFDVENEEQDDPFMGFTQFSTEGITLNNVPMENTRRTSSPTVESRYVYDLYYTHHNLSDLDLESVLTVEALCDDFINEHRRGSPDRDLVHDDSDDSNDESNWRNDYPDEDPRFFENEDEDYDYAEDMIDTNFLNDDDSDLLAYWMDTRCKVDGDSDNDEDEYEDDDVTRKSQRNSDDDDELD